LYDVCCVAYIVFALRFLLIACDVCFVSWEAVAFVSCMKKENDVMNVFVVVRDYRRCDCCDDVETKVMAAAVTFDSAVAVGVQLEKDRIRDCVNDWRLRFGDVLFEKLSVEQLHAVTGEGDYFYRVEMLAVV
jgi:hypothetical protein